MSKNDSCFPQYIVVFDILFWHFELHTHTHKCDFLKGREKHEDEEAWMHLIIFSYAATV